jgi:hypothetical protein
MGKKKISGAARKEINQRRAIDIVKTVSADTTFGRVTKLLGFNHIMIAIQAKAGPKEIRVRIPKLFTKKGATPITTREVVAIYVGPEFDPETVKSTDQFDITAILNLKQANDLVLTGDIPRWMVHEEVVSGNVKSENESLGWEFGYSDKKDDDEESDMKEEEEKEKAVVNQPKGKKNAIVFNDSDSEDSNDIDVDAI